MKKSRLRSVGKKGSILKRLDAMLSKIVIARDGKCLLSGAGMGACGGNLQACHIYPKGHYQAMRYRLENVICGCFAHHSPKSGRSWHSNPMHYAAWYNRTFPDNAQRLLVMSHCKSRIDRKMDAIFLQQELKKYE